MGTRSLIRSTKLTRVCPHVGGRKDREIAHLQEADSPGNRTAAWITAALCTLLLLRLAFALQAAPPTSSADGMSTDERVAQPGWWPTKLLPTRKDFVGTGACTQCHSSLTTAVKDTGMARALLRPEESKVLRAQESHSFQVDSYMYMLEHTPHGDQFSVNRGPETATQPITWAFGDGNISQVFLTEQKGNFYESHFSYFGGIDGFDRTTNQPRRAESISAAVGRTVPPSEVRKCFACHAAGVTQSGGFSDVIPGVSCEACHGPGADHVAAMKAGIEGGDALILNPARLDRTSSVDFCGSCHMTWVDVQLGGGTGPSTVRFPVYRLENSQCWAKGDARITCTGCHDPHQPLVHDAAYYDQKCLGCHVSRSAAAPAKDHPGKACPQAEHNCVSCHMPKREFADAHYSFTDHDIRVVRSGDPVPD